MRSASASGCFFSKGLRSNPFRVWEPVFGVDVDFEYNKNCPRGEEVEISKPGSKVRVFVIPTDEEMVIARDTARLAK